MPVHDPAGTTGATGATGPARTEDRLGPEWVPGPDGIPFRRGARVLLLDEAGDLLLVEGHDGDDEGHRWWFTVGGGIGPEEDPRTGAVRELAEETGIVLDAERLEGPVATRSATFRFVRRTVRQDEVFFVGRVPGHRPATTAAGWTELEREVLDQVRWFSADELDALVGRGGTVYPSELPELLRSLIGGWDGSRPHLTQDG